MTHTYRPAITRLQPLSARMTPAQRRRRAARIARRRGDQAVRAMRQTSIAAEAYRWFHGVITGPSRFRFPSFSGLLQGHRLARFREERSLLRELHRARARTAPQKAA